MAAVQSIEWGKYQFFYDQMPYDDMRDFYRKALEAAQQHAGAFVVDSAPWMGSNKTLSVVDTFLYMYGDHPELFDLYLGKINAISGPMTKVTVALDYLSSKKRAQQRMIELKAAVGRILTECFPQGWQQLSPLRREKILYTYLVSHVTYDHVTLKNSLNWGPPRSDAWSAYGALVNKTAVCEGVACAFKLLCDQVDIPSLVVVGHVGNDRHAWNIVKIGSRFYHVDCTWMLRSSIRLDIPYAKYHYFNVPDMVFEGTRTTEMDYLPKCTSLRANPFMLQGLCAKSLEHAQEVLRNQIQKGERRLAVLTVGFRMNGTELTAIMSRLWHGVWCYYAEDYFIGIVCK